MPSDKEPSPPLYQMKIFAPDTVQAKSRFWYFVAYLKNVKKAAGEVLACDEVSILFLFKWLMESPKIFGLRESLSTLIIKEAMKLFKI